MSFLNARRLTSLFQSRRFSTRHPPEFGLRNLPWLSLSIAVPPTGAVVRTCARLLTVPQGVTLHRLDAPLIESDFYVHDLNVTKSRCHTKNTFFHDSLPPLPPHTRRRDYPVAPLPIGPCLTDGTDTGEFPVNLKSSGFLRGVSHFIVLDNGIDESFHHHLSTKATHLLPSRHSPLDAVSNLASAPCHSLDGPVDLGAAGLAMCIDKAWGVAWPPGAPRAVVLHALVFPAKAMPLSLFRACFPVGLRSGTHGNMTAPRLPYVTCDALPKALAAHLAPRTNTLTAVSEWSPDVVDDGAPLYDSELVGQVTWVLADALRRGAVLPGVLTPTEASLALFMRHHFCMDTIGTGGPLLDEDSIADSDALALIAHKCLQALPPRSHAGHTGFWLARHSLTDHMARVVRDRFGPTPSR
jgi:hypothetical protein